MSQRELDRYDIIKRVIHKELKGIAAAKLLGLSSRQIKRLKAKVIRHKAKGLMHGSCGKTSHNRIPDEERTQIVEILHHRHYAGFKPGFASEKLLERHGIARDPKTIRAIMISEGLWQSRKRRGAEERRSWRPRRDCYGEMEQFDGSYEYWFEDRGPKCCLLAAIDDARGVITKATFGPHEGVVPVFTFWQGYLEEHGRPRSIYLDKFSTYKMNSAVAKENHDLLTQFQRAAEELHIELISANSPQAKGRVERLFATLQDRLIKELRLAGISTIEEANMFLKTYIPKFNNQFGVETANPSDLHAKLNQKEHTRLPSIFSRQETRTVQNDFTISYNNRWYQLTEKQPVIVCKKDKVIIEERLDGSVWIRLRSKYLNYRVLPERPKRASRTIPWVLPAASKQPKAVQSLQKPAPDHPWRRTVYSSKNVLTH